MIRLSLVAGACVLALAGPAAAQERPRVTVQPYVEASQTLAADLEGDDVVTFTTLSAGVDAAIQTRRAEGQISYRYDRFFSWDDDDGDGDAHTGLARGLYRITPNIGIEAGAIATRTRADNRGAAPGLLIGDDIDNISQLYSVFGGVAISQPIGPAQLDTAYRLGYTKVETPDSVLLAPGQGRRDFYDDATSHIGTVRLSTAPGQVAPVGLALSGAFDRERAGQLDQRYDGWLVRGDVLAPVSSTVALTAGVGYEEISISSRDPLLSPSGAPVLDEDGRFVTDPGSPRRVDYLTDGVYYDVGVIWRPNRRTQVTAAVGERYGSFSGTGSISYQSPRGVGVGVVVYDGIQTFGRQLRQGLANLPTEFVAVRDQLTQQFNGCVFGSNAETPGGCLNAVLQSVNATSYRARGIDGVVSAVRGPHQFGVGAGYANRRLHVDRLPLGVAAFGTEDESAYLSGFYSRSLTDVSGYSLQAFFNYHNTIGVSDDEVYATGAVASYFHNFGRLQTTASAGLYSFQVGDFADRLTAQALLAARYNF